MEPNRTKKRPINQRISFETYVENFKRYLIYFYKWSIKDAHFYENEQLLEMYNNAIEIKIAHKLIFEEN